MGGSVRFAEDLRPRQHAIANDAALYFAGTFKNCREPCVAPVAFDPTLRGVAIAPMELRGLIRTRTAISVASSFTCADSLSAG
jgi:hypothetical protein